MYKPPLDKVILIEAYRYSGNGLSYSLLRDVISSGVHYPVADLDRELKAQENRWLISSKINESGKNHLEDFFSNLPDAQLVDYILRELFRYKGKFPCFQTEVLKHIGIKINQIRIESITDLMLKEGLIEEDEQECVAGGDRAFRIKSKGIEIHEDRGYSIFVSQRVAKEKREEREIEIARKKSILTRLDEFCERPFIKVIIRAMAFWGAVITPLYFNNLSKTATSNYNTQQQNTTPPIEERATTNTDTSQLPRQTDTSSKE